MTPAEALQLTLVIPLAGALLVAMTGRWPNLREAITITTGIALLATVSVLVAPVLAGNTPEVLLIETLPGLSLALSVEPLGLLFALVASPLWIVTSIYAIGYNARPQREEPDTFLRGLCGCDSEHDGGCLCGQHVHVVPVL